MTGMPKIKAHSVFEVLPYLDFYAFFCTVTMFSAARYDS